MRRGKQIIRRARIAMRRESAVRKERQTYRRRGKREQTSPPPRRFFQAIICSAIFVMLITLKLVLPGNLSAMRGTLGEWLVRDADFTEAFAALGRAVSGENGVAEAISDAYVAVFGDPDAQEVSGTLLGAEISPEEREALLKQKELPREAMAEQQVLGFAYVVPLSGEVTSPFGWRIDPIDSLESFHYGTDIAADEDTEICCFADGTVGVVGESTELGRYLTVNHENGFSTLYGHCSRITVSSGAALKCGDPIARVGQTGRATGPHLHFEVHDAQGRYLNPVYYLTE